jgi:hypothetical protein
MYFKMNESVIYFLINPDRFLPVDAQQEMLSVPPDLSMTGLCLDVHMTEGYSVNPFETRNNVPERVHIVFPFLHYLSLDQVVENVCRVPLWWFKY